MNDLLGYNDCHSDAERVVWWLAWRTARDAGADSATRIGAGSMALRDYRSFWGEVRV